jgi:hypothetical protein
MSTTLLFAWASPASPEVDDEYSRWYDEVHAPQVKDAVGTAIDRKSVSMDWYSPHEAASSERGPAQAFSTKGL